MISVLKSLASFLFYSVWVIILLDAMIIALGGCVFVTKVLFEEWFGCEIIMFTKVKRLFSQARLKK